MIITKRLVSSFDHIMNGKLFFFKRRSLPRYLVASLLLGFVSPVLGFRGLAAAGIYFVGIMIVAGLAMILSALAQAKTMNFDADVDFSEDKITLRHRNKDLYEEKDWTWIQQMDIKDDRVFLIPNEKRRMVYQLTQLSSEELDFFKARSRVIQRKL